MANDGVGHRLPSRRSWRSSAGAPPRITTAAVVYACAAVRPPERRTSLAAHAVATRSAAILVPIVPLGDEVGIVVTKRSARLTSHRGDWVFPGGNVDTADLCAVDTAVRETAEELGVDARAITVLGELDGYGPIISGHVVRVFVGLLDDADLDPNPAEVQEALIVALSTFFVPGAFYENANLPEGYIGGPGLEDQARRSGTVNRPQPFFVLRPGELLWGAQGEVLSNLLDVLTASTVSPRDNLHP